MTARLSIDVRHHRGKDGSTRATKQALLAECARSITDKNAPQRWAARNPEMDPSRTHLNEVLVNDGAGGFRSASSINEILDYRDARVARVKRKISDRTFTDDTIVVHYSKEYCHEETWTGADGKERVRYVPDDMDHMRRFFSTAVGHIADHIGGQEAIHAVVLNMDETTPHIHVLSDPFEPDPKNPGYLRAAASKFWYQEKGGETGRHKMARFHAEGRQRMVDAGFDIDLESSERSTERISLDSFKELQDQKAEIAERTEDLEFREGMLRAGEDGLRRRSARVTERENDVDEREAAVEAREAALSQQQARFREEMRQAKEAQLRKQREIAAEREKATQEGHREGLAAGRQEAATELDRRMATVVAGLHEMPRGQYKTPTEAVLSVVRQALRVPQADGSTKDMWHESPIGRRIRDRVRQHIETNSPAAPTGLDRYEQQQQRLLKAETRKLSPGSSGPSRTSPGYDGPSLG